MNQLDDVDRLFARLEPIAPPDALVARAIAESEARQARRRLWLAIPCYCGALLVIAVVSFLLGRALVFAGAGDLLSMAVEDPATVTDAPLDYAQALAEAFSWGHLAVLVLACGALAWFARLVAGARATVKRVGT
jgi:hypothetical protein